MKRLLLSITLLASAMMGMAQEDNQLFNHMSVGVNLGTTGIGIDVAVPATKYLQIRAGYNFFPKIKYTTDINIQGLTAHAQIPDYVLPSVPREVDVKAETNFSSGKLLLDVYPLNSSWHITAGAFFGSSQFITLNNETPLTGVNQANEAIRAYNKTTGSNIEEIGLRVGDRLLTPDKAGYVNAEVKVGGFRPYIGTGFGRAVPKGKVGFMFDAGVQFWGSPKIYCNGEEIRKGDFTDEDAKKAIDTLSKISVYPVINLRVCFRAF